MAAPPPPNKGEIREGKSEREETVVLTNYSYNIFPHKLLKTWECEHVARNLSLMQVRELETLVSSPSL